MKNKQLFLLLLSCISLQLAAQRCGTMDYLRQQMLENPSLKSRLELLELQQQAVESDLHGSASREILRIPVVVHVIYKTTTENISDQQVYSQIDVLNKDYRRQNTDAGQTPSIFQGIAADTEIEFCLATRDPDGHATNGINRFQTTASVFQQNDNMKHAATGGVNAWPSNRYLNIWVCNLVEPVLGFGTIPGTASAENDGVVIKYKFFGSTGTVSSPYHKGRTATHEVGHWLNLMHTWGDDEGDSDNCSGTDLISDTPNQGASHFGCPAFPQPSCGNISDMFMNYMDYTDDACMNLFTNGQKLRMQAALRGFRSSILTSSGCVPALTAEDCDTLYNISGGDGLVYYAASEINSAHSGYFTGTNSKNDKAFAEKYSTPVVRVISTLRFDFAAASAANASGFITATVWDNDGQGGAPGTALAQQQIFLQAIAQNVENFTFTDAEFSSPAGVTGDYYVGFQLYQNPGDSISVYSNQFDQTNINTGWIKGASDEWTVFNQTSGDSGLSLAIRPVECLDVGLKPVDELAFQVFPNPGTGTFYVESGINNQRFGWQLFSVEGRLIADGVANPGNIQVIETGVSVPGMYVLRIASGKMLLTKKVIIQ